MGGFSVFYSHKEIDSDSDLKEKNIFNSLWLSEELFYDLYFHYQSKIQGQAVIYIQHTMNTRHTL